jgi:hypothetical protein
MHSLKTLLLVAALFAGATAGGSYEEETFDNGWVKKGPRSTENIKQNVTRILPRIYYLYAEALGPDTSLKGTVTIRMEVDRKGKVGFVDVHESTLKKEELHDLILAALVESLFDECKEGREITEMIFPIVLTPDKAGDAPKSRARRVFEEQQKRKAELDAQDTTSRQEESVDEWGVE